MADFWIQLENKPWDVCPKDLGRNRMTGETAEQRSGGHAPVTKRLTSPVTGAIRDLRMFQPLDGDALIYRRYTPNWAAPDDRKVNPWDLNEPDPTDGNPTNGGTMGTIPGPVLEFDVGDSATVHFRNLDMRTRIVRSIEEIELFPTTEGPWTFGPFFPPIDIDLFIPHETQVPLDVLRRTHSIHPHGVVFAATSDGAYPLSPPDPANLVPVGAQADPILEMDRVAWVAAGFAEGAQKKGDRVPPGGIFTYAWNTFGWPTTAGVWLYHDHSVCDDENIALGAIGIIVIHNGDDEDVQVTNADFPGGSAIGSPVAGGVYRTPPNGKAQYLQLYHSLAGQGMLINGRKYLGNTPTMVAGPQTKMRFGVVGMGSDAHTFHLHGHRWVIPGPAGTPLNAENARSNPLDAIVSQFEDTRMFGPANSFAFTVKEGTSFMRAEPPVGEWHMHCHVLMHMMEGMMGSLLVVNDGDTAVPLPVGEACMPMPATSMAGATTVSIEDNQFNPVNATINAGDSVHWINNGAPHTVTSNGKPGAVFNCTPVSAESFDSGAMSHGATFDHMFMNPGSYSYHCEVHGCTMAGTIVVH